MTSPRPPSGRLVPALAAVAFISLGLPDGLLGVAWPSMRASFGVELDALGGLLAAATAGYVVSSFFSGRILQRINLGVVLAASCALTACGLLGFAWSGRWLPVLALAAVLGLGAGAIDAALNTHVATHYSARMLNWLHACFGIGAATGPLLMTAVLREGSTWRRGYVLVGLAQLGLAGCFALTRRSWPSAGGHPHGGAAPHTAAMRATLRLPAAWLGMTVFVAYAGIEASIGAWTYTLLTEGRGVAAPAAGIMASLFWGGMTAGRLLAAAGGGLIAVPRLLRAALGAIVLATLMILAGGASALTGGGLLLAGLACGPIFPGLIATTPGRVGKSHAANTVGFQIAASAAGLSLVPGLVGVAAARHGMETIARLFVVLGLVLVAAHRLLEALPPREDAA